MCCLTIELMKLWRSVVSRWRFYKARSIKASLHLPHEYWFQDATTFLRDSGLERGASRVRF